MHESPPSERQFHPRLWRTVVALAIAFATIGAVGWQAPVALVYAAPLLGLALVLVAFLNSGLILSHEGIAWYVVRPRWRFRRVPWSAIRDIRRGLFGLGSQILLTVESGRYEPWVWGTPRGGRSLTLEIWPNYLAHGEEVWDALQDRWQQSRPTV